MWFYGETDVEYVFLEKKILSLISPQCEFTKNVIRFKSDFIIC